MFAFFSCKAEIFDNLDKHRGVKCDIYSEHFNLFLQIKKWDSEIAFVLKKRFDISKHLFLS